MWTLEEIREEYDRLDRYLGIDTRAIRLSFSKRMRQQHGVCCFRGGRPTEIRLADFLRADDEAMLDTARHEYAHAAAALLTGQRHGHDAALEEPLRQDRLQAGAPRRARLPHRRQKTPGAAMSCAAKRAAPRAIICAAARSCRALSRGGRTAAAAAAADGHLRWKG